MPKIETLEVQIRYRVGLGGVNVPEKVLQQLNDAADKGKELDLNSRDNSQYAEATEWLIDNIRERDCFEWSAEIEDLTLPDK